MRATLIDDFRDPDRSTVTGTFDTWESLDTTRSWSVLQNLPGSVSRLIRFEIRDANQILQDQADIRLTANLIQWDAP